MPSTDQVILLEHHRLWIARELEYLKAGDVLITDHRGIGYHRALYQAKMRRLVKLAQSFDYWLDDDTKSAA